jgi:SNF2 family DNA or RNA helicase
MVYCLVAKDTIEEKLCQILQDKQDVLTRTLDGEKDVERLKIDIYTQLEREILKGPQ